MIVDLGNLPPDIFLFAISRPYIFNILYQPKQPNLALMLLATFYEFYMGFQIQCQDHML